MEKVQLKGTRLTGTEIISGRAATTAKAISTISEAGHRPVFIKKMTEPEDVPTMRMSAAVVTTMGGPTCHAAIVCRTLGIPCVTGVQGLLVNSEHDIVVRVGIDRFTFKCGHKVIVGLTGITFEKSGGDNE